MPLPCKMTYLSPPLPLLCNIPHAFQLFYKIKYARPAFLRRNFIFYRGFGGHFLKAFSLFQHAPYKCARFIYFFYRGHFFRCFATSIFSSHTEASATPPRMLYFICVQLLFNCFTAKHCRSFVAAVFKQPYRNRAQKPVLKRAHSQKLLFCLS